MKSPPESHQLSLGSWYEGALDRGEGYSLRRALRRVRGVNRPRTLRTVMDGRAPDPNARVSKVSRKVPGVDRSRKVASGRIVRNPAPMLVLRTLMLKMMVNFREAASGALKINSLEGALRIEWE